MFWDIQKFLKLNNHRLQPKEMVKETLLQENFKNLEKLKQVSVSHTDKFDLRIYTHMLETQET